MAYFLVTVYPVPDTGHEPDAHEDYFLIAYDQNRAEMDVERVLHVDQPYQIEKFNYSKHGALDMYEEFH